MKQTKIIIPLSGGKDSQAAMIWAIEKYGLQNCETAFCDVKWEAEETYKHINYLVNKSGVKHNVLTSKKYDGMIDLAIKKKRFPSTNARFCTEELKIYPMIDFILSQTSNVIVIDGIRADESESRSKKQADCRYFKYYFEPYRTNSMILEKYSNRPPISANAKLKLKTAIERLEKGLEDAKYFTYRKKDVLQWCKIYDDSLIRPFFNSTADEVLSYSLNKDYYINPLYFQGFSRVGCEPCIMGNSQEIKNYVFNKPLVIEKIRAAELKAGSSFFAPDKTPKRYHSQKTKEGKSFSNINDVVQYVMDKNNTPDIFKDEPLFKCKSFYNICE